MSWILLAIVWAIPLAYYSDLYFNYPKHFIWPKVSETSWNMGYLSVAFAFLALVCMGISVIVFKDPIPAALMIPPVLLGLFGWYILTYPLTVVRSDPPEVGVLTFWTTRYPVLLPEKEYKLLKFFPFNLGVAISTAETIPFDFTYENVPCKSDTGADGKGVGAFVTVRVVGNIDVDHMLDDKDARGNDANSSEGARRVINFQNKGSAAGVLKTLDGVIGQGVREHALGYAWEEYLALKAALAATLLASISTARPRKLERFMNADGVIVKPNHHDPEAENYLSANDYLKLPIIETPLVYVCSCGPDENGKKERRNRIVEMEFFLEMVREGGFSDVPDLGVQFSRFNVPEIVPTGATKEAADKAAAEKKEREQETADTMAQIALAKLYINESPDPKPTMEQALSYVRRRQNPGVKEIFIHGSSRPLTDAAAIFADAKG
ncbi:MAG: hypothetical protein Q8O19_06535 [Rectinemataceae bacterium]|nr:hypothetical protein [Rectinemataceae bacterium]